MVFEMSESKPGSWLRTGDPVADAILSGHGLDVGRAEEVYLEEHLAEVVRLVDSEIPDTEFRRHPLIVLLLARGSRGLEESPL
jgi:hypothetical protein